MLRSVDAALTALRRCCALLHPPVPRPESLPDKQHNSVPHRQRSGPLRPAYQSRSEEHTSELQSLMRISYAVFCLKKKNNYTQNTTTQTPRKINNTQHTAINLHHAHTNKNLTITHIQTRQ